MFKYSFKIPAVSAILRIMVMLFLFFSFLFSMGGDLSNEIYITAIILFILNLSIYAGYIKLAEKVSDIRLKIIPNIIIIMDIIIIYFDKNWGETFVTDLMAGHYNIISYYGLNELTNSPYNILIMLLLVKLVLSIFLGFLIIKLLKEKLSGSSWWVGLTYIIKNALSLGVLCLTFLIKILREYFLNNPRFLEGLVNFLEGLIPLVIICYLLFEVSLFFEASKKIV